MERLDKTVCKAQQATMEAKEPLVLTEETERLEQRVLQDQTEIKVQLVCKVETVQQVQMGMMDRLEHKDYKERQVQTETMVQLA